MILKQFRNWAASKIKEWPTKGPRIEISLVNRRGPSHSPLSIGELRHSDGPRIIITRMRKEREERREAKKGDHILSLKE